LQGKGLVPLPDSRFLLWEADGRLQVGSPENGWGPVLRLPMTYIVSATAEDPGALLGGSFKPEDGGTERPVAVAVDAQGTVRMRWEGEVGIFDSVTSEQGRRQAVVLDQWVELLPDGAVRPVEKVPRLSQVLVGPGGQQVLCTSADLTLAHAAWASCHSHEQAGWRVEGNWRTAPLLCGEWLVTHEGRALVVRTVASGQERARRVVTTERVLACGRPGELLSAGTRVQALALPSLEPRWRAPCGRGRVVALAARGESVACLDASGRVKRLEAR
jgi:hypothetical protein